MLKKLRNRIDTYFPASASFVLGVSGGPDSMALLHMLKELDRSVLVVHVNYGLRGDESDADQEMVEGFSAEWGFECCSVKVNPDTRILSNIQEWARDIRYEIFFDLMREEGHQAVITAHHQDDQVETILQKLLSGSAPSNWQGMLIHDQKLFRPLLDVTRSDILKYINERAVPYQTDSSNASTTYYRNAIRHSVGPVFDHFSPGWRSNILQLQSFGKMNLEAVKWITDDLFKEDGLPVDRLVVMPSELTGAVIKKAIEERYPEVRLTKGLIAELIQLLVSQPGRLVEIDHNLCMVRDQKKLTLKMMSDPRISFAITQSDVENGIALEGWRFIMEDISQAPFDDGLWISTSAISWPLEIQNWDRGDRFQPLGMDRHTNVSDHLTNRKIPSSLKENTLKLTGADGTIHALMYPQVASNGEYGMISEHAKVTDKDLRVLTITKNEKL